MKRPHLIALGAIAALAFGLVLVIQLAGGRSDFSAAASGEQALAAFAAYQESGDPADLDSAEDLAKAALRSDSEDVLAVEAKARAALSRHDFRQGLTLAIQAARLTPDRFAPIGLRADALVELGRYAPAFSAAERRLTSRPDLESYARASYAFELQGDVASATELMQRAVETSPAGSFGRTATQIQLVQLLLRYGAIGAADRVVSQATAENPGDAEWVINKARVAVARGELSAARRIYRSAIEEIPDADHLAELAEVESALGDEPAARGYLERSTASYAEAAEIEDNELERLTLAADWGTTSEGDIARAREARERRPSVLGDSTLGWVLAKAGRCDEATTWARKSLRLGYKDPLFVFRAAYAESCAGNLEHAQRLIAPVLDATPHFSPRFAPLARDLSDRRPVGENVTEGIV